MASHGKSWQVMVPQIEYGVRPQNSHGKSWQVMEPLLSVCPPRDDAYGADDGWAATMAVGHDQAATNEPTCPQTQERY